MSLCFSIFIMDVEQGVFRKLVSVPAEEERNLAEIGASLTTKLVVLTSETYITVKIGSKLRRAELLSSNPRKISKRR